MIGLPCLSFDRKKFLSDFSNTSRRILPIFDNDSAQFSSFVQSYQDFGKKTVTSFGFVGLT
jgi:hypothetical protein